MASILKKNLKILIVEDDQLMSGLIYTSLLNNGYERIYRAARLDEGIRLYKKHKIPAILMDINLPDGNGLEAAEAIKSENDRIMIIMISAEVGVPIVEKVIALDLDGLVTKPLSPIQLLKVFESAIDKKINP